jgi:hypothetical protein
MASGEILFHFITSGTLWDMFSLHRKTTTTWWLFEHMLS